VPQVVLSQYAVRPTPSRLAVGDVIRCQDFRVGLRWHQSPGEILVGWRDRHYRDYHAQAGNGVAADDDSRAAAAFLVIRVELTESEGPDDVCPGNHRLSRDVWCVRLDAGLGFSAASERIRFSLDEPMSVARPDEAAIEVLGWAELPVSWDVPEIEG